MATQTPRLKDRELPENSLLSLIPHLDLSLSTITKCELHARLWLSEFFRPIPIRLWYFSPSDQNLMVCFLITVILRTLTTHAWYTKPTSCPTPVSAWVSSLSELLLTDAALYSDFFHKLFPLPAMTTPYAPGKQTLNFHSKALLWGVLLSLPAG